MTVTTKHVPAAPPTDIPSFNACHCETSGHACVIWLVNGSHIFFLEFGV